MQYTCKKCGTVNALPSAREGKQLVCCSCGADIPPIPEDDGSIPAAIGLMGGAMLGASLGGPPGAVIGGVVGAVLGKQAKGVG